MKLFEERTLRTEERSVVTEVSKCSFAWIVFHAIIAVISMFIGIIIFGWNGEAIGFGSAIAICSFILSWPALFVALLMPGREDPFVAYLMTGFCGGYIAIAFFVIGRFLGHTTSPFHTCLWVAGFAFVVGLFFGLMTTTAQSKSR